MKYANWDHSVAKKDREFDRAILACEQHRLYDLMGFLYDWNMEVLAQFHATFYYNVKYDEIH
jgi:hypothetical protein